jgi:hypothetical protein
LVHYCASLGEDKHPKIDELVEQYHTDDPDFHQMVADMAEINRKTSQDSLTLVLCMVWV